MKSFRVSKDTCCSGTAPSSGTEQHREQDVAKLVKPVQSANHLAWTIKLWHNAPADLLQPDSLSRTQMIARWSQCTLQTQFTSALWRRVLCWRQVTEDTECKAKTQTER